MMAMVLRLVPAFVVAFGLFGAFVTTAFGEEARPGWELVAETLPTNLIPVAEGSGQASGTIAIDVFNVGAGEAGGIVTLTDVLPPGIKAKQAGLLVKEGEAGENFGVHSTIGVDEFWDCTGNEPGGQVEGASVVTCTLEPGALSQGAESIFAGGGGLPVPTPEDGHNISPPVGISVQAAAAASGLVNRVSVAGGGALSGSSTSDPVTVSSAPAGPGFETWDAWFSNANGTIDTQAGSHPYEATFDFSLNTALEAPNEAGERNGLLSEAEPRSLEVRLPPGFVGDPLAVPQCTPAQLTIKSGEGCPADTQVGRIDVPSLSGLAVSRDVFNMVPRPGVAAEFGLNFEGILVYLDSTVRTGGDDGVSTHVDNIPQRVSRQSILTLWDVPGEASHDLWRCGRPGGCHAGAVFTPAEPARSFLTLPTSCEGAQPFSISFLSGWEAPHESFSVSATSHNAFDEPVGFTGCSALSFGPSIAIGPDTAQADHPAGLSAEVKPPLGGLEEPGQLGTSDIQNTTVKLPVGFVINPGQAVGLQACPHGKADPLPGQERYGDNLPSPQEQAEGRGETEEFYGAAFCPGASKVGTVEIESPLIEAAREKLFKGNVYVLQSQPPNLELLLAATADGVNLKLVGKVHLCESSGEVVAGKTCEAPGQLITTFEHTPALPFTVFSLKFSGGQQAALDTPAHCGTYTTTSDFTPWSNPFIGEAFPTAQFNITEGPGGSACPPSPLPFTPELTAGTTADHAGAFTNFSLLLQRSDAQQRISGLRVEVPEGLTGFISNVQLCTNAQAESNSCPEASKIGHTVAESGAGSYPLVVPEPGRGEAPIYLTEAYEGAPFGLSFVVPLKVGPFELPTQRVRAKIEIDPHTAQIVGTSNELPQQVAGVPTDLRAVDAVIERPEFLVNPTSCEAKEFTGTAYGTPPPGSSEPAQTASIASHFKVEGCGALKFTPSLATTTAAHASKKDGAALTFKISYPKAPQGTEAWFNEAKFDIPKQLPARLTTIQRACLAATFESNRAACPVHSVIGHAIVHTPLLPVPLEGPVYFVSYGGAKFPDAVVVLQGDGVTVELTGETFIDKKTGVTSATFPNTPDVPFENIEVTLPTGEYSEFGANLPEKANDDFCGQKLEMPTFFKASNGLEIRQDTPVQVVGCPKAKPKKKGKKAGRATKSGRAHRPQHGG
jgi:hypothetical protein